MATSTRGGQAHYVEFDEYVDSKIVRTRDVIRSTDIMVALIAAVAAVLGYLLLFVIADHWLGMDFVAPVIRLAIGVSILGGSLAWACWRIGLPHRRRINRLFVAREIETHESALEGNLLNLVDLQQAKRDVDLPVMRSIEKRAAVGLSQADLDGTVNRGPLMRSAYTLLGLVVLSCLYTLLTVSLGLKPIGPSLMRAFGATSTAPTRIRFETVEVQIADGGSFVDAAEAPRVPARFQPVIKATLNKALEEGEHVTLYFTTADQRFVDQPLEMRPVDGSSQEVYPEFSLTLLGENDRGLLQDVSFRIEAGDATTPDYSIQVSTVPSATVLSIDYTYPKYMQLADESRESANIEAWEGTRVTLHATASQPVKSARLVFSDTEDTTQRAEEYPMRVTDGTKLSVAWNLAFRNDKPEDYPKFYRIVCQDDQGATDLHPTLHTIEIRPDLPPEVELLDPRADLELPSNAIVPLLVKARDPDFQLKHLTLRVELDGKQLVEHNLELFAGEQPSFGPQSVDYPLEPLGLQPGQTISYWIEARDNKVPLGNRTNTAPKLNIRITEPVTPEEARKQRDEQRKQQQEQVRQEQEKQQQENGGDENQPPDDGGEGDPDGTDAKPRDDTTDEPGQDGKPQKGDSPSDGDAKGDKTEKREPGDAKSDTPKGQDGDKPGEKPKPQPGDQKGDSKSDPAGGNSGDTSKDKSQSGDTSNSSSDNSKPGSGDPDPNAEPLNNDGSDDAEALKRVRDFQNKSDAGDNSDGKPGSGESDPDAKTADPNSNPDQSDPKGKSSSEDPKAKPGGRDGKKKGKTGTRPDDKRNDPKKASSAKKTSRDPDGKPADKKAGSGDTAADKKAAANAKKKKGEAGNDSKSKGQAGDKKNGSKKPGKKGTEPDGSPSTPKSGKGNQPPRKSQGSSGGSKTKKGAGGQKGEGSDPNGKPKAADKKQNGSDSKAGAAKKGARSKDDDPKNAQPSDSKSDKRDKKGGKGDGKAGDKPGDKPGDKKGGKKDGKKDSAGGSPAKPGGKPGGKPSDKPGSKGGKGASGKNAVEGTGGTGKRAGSAQQGNDPGAGDRKGQGTGSEVPEADPANEDFSKEAANLVLKRLEDELQRGKVDPELLKKLGWTKEDVSKFAGRIRDNVDVPQDDNSPQSQARRRQFEDLLKSITIKSQGTKRTGRSERTRKTDSINSQDIPVPLQFREAVKLYRRNLTGRRTRAPLRPTKPTPKPNSTTRP